MHRSKKIPTTLLHTKLSEAEIQLSEEMKSAKHNYESHLINTLATGTPVISTNSYISSISNDH